MYWLMFRKMSSYASAGLNARTGASSLKMAVSLSSNTSCELLRVLFKTVYS